MSESPNNDRVVSDSVGDEQGTSMHASPPLDAKAKRAPFFLEKLDVLAVRCSAFLLFSGIAIGAAYSFSTDTAVRHQIYLVSGSLFWADFYFFIAAAFALILLFFDLERKIKSANFHSSDKLELLRAYYLSPSISAAGKVSVCLCGAFVILVFSSAGLGVGLAVSKSFLMR